MPKVSYHRVLDEHLHTLVAQGNHEAYDKLKKRYHYHSLTLCRDILKQYSKTGINVHELLSVCENKFAFIVGKYDPAVSSFYTYWKEVMLREIMDYLIDNSYAADVAGLKNTVSIDDEFDDKHTFSDYIHEKDDDREKKRKIFEIKNVIARHDDVFLKQESMLLNLVLDGYSIADLEHSGVMSRSKLYLTFNSAVVKLKKLIRRIK